MTLKVIIKAPEKVSQPTEKRRETNRKKTTDRGSIRMQERKKARPALSPLLQQALT